MSERNNEQRLGEAEPASVPFKQLENKSNDPLAFLSPTQFVELPSKGKFYPTGHPLKDKETVEIRFMTAKEEDILTSKSLLKKGIAIDRMLESLLVDKSIKLDDLLVGDKNALIVAARTTGYGEDYETKVSCPSCGASVRHNFDLGNLKCKFPEESIAKQLSENGLAKFKLPISKFEVEIKLLKGSDEKIVTKMAEERKALKQEDKSVTDQLRLFVVSINGVKDRNILDKFIEVCPAGDAKYLRLKHSQMTPNLDMTQNFTCRSCDSEMEMEVPFTVDFFWSGR